MIDNESPTYERVRPVGTDLGGDGCPGVELPRTYGWECSTLPCVSDIKVQRESMLTRSNRAVPLRAATQPSGRNVGVDQLEDLPPRAEDDPGTPWETQQRPRPRSGWGVNTSWQPSEPQQGR